MNSWCFHDTGSKEILDIFIIVVKVLFVYFFGFSVKNSRPEKMLLNFFQKNQIDIQPFFVFSCIRDVKSS